MRTSTLCNIVLLSIISPLTAAKSSAPKKHISSFPASFKFGAGSSAYQTEGAWNVSGKGESIWDRAVHTPGLIYNGSTGDIAADSYHKWRDDVRLLKQLRVHFYRFSICWPRIFPNGTINYLNQDGVNYYNNLINGLLKAGVQPMVTLFHWDTPQALQDVGGWTNDKMLDWFLDYADKMFELFGDRVKTWATVNEPETYCRYGYSNKLAPFIDSPEYGAYICGHNMIRGHAKVYRHYVKKYKKKQKGKVGIALNSHWVEPKDPESVLDQLAAQVAMDFQFGWFCWPIFKTGAYPNSMRTMVDYRSYMQNYSESRLPKFTAAERKEILGSYDYLGLNHYSTDLASFSGKSLLKATEWPNDANLVYSSDPKWQKTGYMDMYVLPDSFRKLVIWLGRELGPDVKIDVTENGYAGVNTDTELDTARIHYLNVYLQALLDAMNNGTNVIGYTWWSSWDNFEWANGYKIQFGLYKVDYNSPNRTRIPRRAAMVYQNIIVTRQLNPGLNPDHFLH